MHSGKAACLEDGLEHSSLHGAARVLVVLGPGPQPVHEPPVLKPEGGQDIQINIARSSVCEAVSGIWFKRMCLLSVH